ncbi:alpha-ketoglutarate-dependent dioxygenase AlkB family protein [Shewanella algae]|uniref:alpha-ketoglutarate-dependent dioxygenase AlkB family protein n=1 Tax=Shewanella algae TaxID=38313 RepID=UPI003AAC7B19
MSSKEIQQSLFALEPGPSAESTTGVQRFEQPPMLLVRGYLNPAQQDAIWREAEHYPLTRPELEIFGKRHAIPRTQVWFGDPGCDYRYSGLLVRALPWPKYLLRLRQKLDRDWLLGSNGVLVNRYADGRDAMGWHSDDEPELAEGADIASISLGAGRDFDLRHKQSGEKLRLRLNSGDLLLMRWPMQQEWQHALPRRLKLTEPRLNLTYRRLKPGFHPPGG